MSLIKKLMQWRDILLNALSPVLLLIIRLYMANIFFKSGWLKFENYLNDNWGTTVYLFQDIHPVPPIPAEIAAIMATGGEIMLAVLLAFGLFSRFAAFGLIIMTCVIQFMVPVEYDISNPEHYVWMMLLGVILVKGAGLFSVDKIVNAVIGRNDNKFDNAGTRSI